MLQTIREKSQGWIATVILGLVCFSFALWGIHYYLTQSKAATVVAKVNGVKITENLFDSTLRQLQQQAQVNLGNSYSNSPTLQNQLKKQALAQLINEQILVNALSKQGFFVGQEQVDQLILQVPAFQQNGKFSSVRFQQALSVMQTSPQVFMKKLSDQVMAGQLHKGLVDSNFSLPDDVTNAIHLMKQTRDVGFIRVNTSDVKVKLDVSNKAIKQYYDAHQKQFTKPERVSLDYILLSVDGLKAKQKVTEQAIKSYYKNNPQQFTNSKKSLEQARGQITNILKQQEAEKAFAKTSDDLANLTYESPDSLQTAADELNLQVQTTPSIAKGAKGKGILSNPKVLMAAFSNDVYQEGYNSDVIELSPSKQVVIRVKHKTPAQLMPMESVKPQIVEILEKQNKQLAAKALATKVSKELATGKPGSQVAKQYGLSWHERTNVDRHQKNVDTKVLLQVFQMQKPFDRKHPTTKVMDLPNGDYAAVVLYEINSGKADSITDIQKQAFKEVIGKKYGNVDYQLFLESMKHKAKVKQYINLDHLDNQ